ncbi:MAG: hypothetical protein J6U54_20425 [Clostridiales bacterium]|nr:hypothetical protein [Clostridiales bacterium]
MEYKPSYVDNLYLAHHGIKGQKWGVRRFQNPDGSLTPAGRKRIISAHEKRGRAIGRITGQIGGYFLYNNADDISSKVSDKTKETAKRIGNTKPVAKASEAAKRIGNTKPVAKASEAAKNVGKKVSDKLDTDTTRKIRDKAGEVISIDRETIKRGADKAKEIKKTIDDDPIANYYMSDLAMNASGALGERIGAAAGRKIGEASASIQSAYGRHKVKQLMQKNRHVKHADIYSDYLMHHGIRGMHWGVRRFEDYSGHLTSAGKRRYDKYDYNTKPTSKTSRKSTRSSKKGMTTGQKLALGAGAALTIYGAAKIAKGRSTLNGMKSQIESTHKSELEGLDPKKRKRILKRVAKEQIYEANRIKQLEKSKDPNASTKIKNASKMLSDEHISYRINKMKPRKLRDKNIKPVTVNTSGSNNTSKKKNASSKIFDDAAEFNRKNKANNKSVAIKKKPGQISSETAAIFNANRMASLGLNPTSNQKIGTRSSTKAVVTRTEPVVKKSVSKPVKPAKSDKSANTSKKSFFKRKEKEPKPKKKRDPIETAMRAKKAFDTVSAVKNRDYGQAVYNVSTEIINATDKRIAEAKKKRSKSK